MKGESSLGKRDNWGKKKKKSALARQCTAAESPSKSLHPAPTEFEGFQETSTESMLNNSKKLKIHSELPRLIRGWATTSMAFPTFPVFYPESALNPYSVPQLLSWMMLRSNFASDFNISFCKSLSVSICSFRAFSFPPSNLVCLDFGTCPRSLFFWNFFPVRPLGCLQTSQKKKKRKKYPMQNRLTVWGEGKKTHPTEFYLLKNSLFKCCYKSQSSPDLQYSLILSVPSKALEFISSS